MTTRLIDALAQMLGDDGNPIAGAQLRFLVAGSTGTTAFQNTYADLNLSIANANPLPLEAGGRVPPVFVQPVYYRIRYENSDGSLIKEADYVGGPEAQGQYGAWNNEQVYSQDEIVYYLGKYYRSIDSGNQNNEPGSTPDWTELNNPEKYSALASYGVDRLVYDSGVLYRSTQALNLGNTPAASPDFWDKINGIPAWGSSTSFKINDFSIDSAGNLQKASANSINVNPTTPSTSWNQVHEDFEWNSAKTYASGAQAWRSGYRYFSQQAANLNHDPATDTAFTWWKPEWATIDALTKVKWLSGGGALTAYFENVLTDSGIYAIPLASSVPANGALLVTKNDANRAGTPTIQTQGGNTLTWSGAPDTAMQLLTTKREVYKLVSDGVSTWRIS